MRRFGLAWLPLRESTSIGTISTCRTNLSRRPASPSMDCKAFFRNWKDVSSATREYSRARELEVRLRASDTGNCPDVLESMRNMVYQHFALQVIRQMRVLPEVPSTMEEDVPGYKLEYLGLSYDVIRALTGEATHLSCVRKGQHGLGNTYAERVHCLFSWDDGVARTFWDHCYYRQLARRFYASISSHAGAGEADNWRDITRTAGITTLLDHTSLQQA